MATAALLPLGPWPEVLTAARAAGPSVALVEGATSGPDAWCLASALAVALPDVRLLVVVDPARRSAGVLALMAATLDSLSGGRLVLAIEDGEGADEAWSITDRLLRGETVSLVGKYHRADEAVVGLRPVQSPRPPLLRRAGPPGVYREGDQEWVLGNGPGSQ